MEGLRYFKRRKQGDEGVAATVRNVRVEQICPCSFLPQEECSSKQMQDLADSIRRFGILEPLIIRESEYEKKERKLCQTTSGSEITLISDRVYDPYVKKPLYEVISGEKRLNAAKMLGMETVPCLLMECEKEKAAELTVILRTCRADRHPLDVSNVFSSWMRAYGLSRSEAAAVLPYTEKEIGEFLSFSVFSNLEKKVLRLCYPGKDVMVSLASIRESSVRARLLGKTVEEGLSAHQVRELIRKEKQKSNGSNQIGVVRDVRFFINTFDRAVESMQNSGFDVEYEKTIDMGTAGILVLIHTENVSRETLPKAES